MAENFNYREKLFELLGELPDFVSDFIINFSDPNKLATKLEYTRDIKIFFEYIINYIPEYTELSIMDITLDTLSHIEPNDINQYLTILSSSGNSENTVKRKRASISKMYTYFVSSDKVPRNPVAAARTIKVPQKPLIYLTNEEQSILLEAVRTGYNDNKNIEKRHNLFADRDSAMFLLLLDTGLRVSEMVGTDIDDYNLEECSVVVKRKGGDIQTVYYSDECAEYLAVYFDKQKDRYRAVDGPLPAFTSTTGVRIGVRAVEMLVKKYITACIPEKAKIISPHKMRSSFAMSFYEASDNNILLLQKKLNHKHISTTNIYAKASEQEIRDSRMLLQGRR